MMQLQQILTVLSIIVSTITILTVLVVGTRAFTRGALQIENLAKAVDNLSTSMEKSFELVHARVCEVEDQQIWHDRRITKLEASAHVEPPPR